MASLHRLGKLGQFVATPSLPFQRRPLAQWAQQIHMDVVRARRNRLCPCCQETRIVGGIDGYRDQSLITGTAAQALPANHLSSPIIGAYSGSRSSDNDLAVHTPRKGRCFTGRGSIMWFIEKIEISGGFLPGLSLWPNLHYRCTW